MKRTILTILRVFFTAFCVCGVLVYVPLGISTINSGDSGAGCIILALAVLMVFFIWLMWRPKRNAASASSVSQLESVNSVQATENRKRCSQCGMEIPDYARFCTKCGAEQTSAASASSTPIVIETSHPSGSGKGFADLFKANENAALKAKIAELEAMLTPESRDIQSAQRALTQLHASIDATNAELIRSRDALHEIQKNIEEAKAELIEVNDAVLLQSFGLYEPKYAFANSSQYKDKLQEIRAKQKEMVRAGTAASGVQNWTVNGDAKKGTRMVNDTKKLLLRAFNTECDDLISAVKFSNIESAEKRMRTSRDAISKLGTMMSISISPAYFRLKTDELHLAYEFALQKQREKEEQRRVREEQREQAKLEKEIEEARKKLQKEQAHCRNELDRMLTQDTSGMNDAELEAFNTKRAELTAQLDEIEKGISDVDYRAANQRAGYVYVISNIGSFGQDVYKIGMTRRLNPMDRVDELGDASVPFKFDVHAMIFSEDAPRLESALHRAFEDRKVNMVNTRREFFHVTLDEIKQVIKENFDKTVEFTDTADAEQYRESELIRSQMH